MDDNLKLFLDQLKGIAMHRAGGKMPGYFEGGPPYGQVENIVSQDKRVVTTRVSGVLGSWFGVDPKEVIAAWDEANPEAITLLIDSPGGLVSAGLSLYADLMARQKDSGVVVRSEARGVVASSAVLPFLAGSERIMREGSELMVHAPWTFAFLLGGQAEMDTQYQRVMAGLASASERNRTIIEKRTGKDAETVKGWVAKDTWFQPQESLDAGFATGIDEAVEDEGDGQGEMSELQQAFMRVALVGGY